MWGGWSANPQTAMLANLPQRKTPADRRGSLMPKPEALAPLLPAMAAYRRDLQRVPELRTVGARTAGVLGGELPA
jgi:hypothetical protein